MRYTPGVLVMITLFIIIALAGFAALASYATEPTLHTKFFSWCVSINDMKPCQDIKLTQDI